MKHKVQPDQKMAVLVPDNPQESATLFYLSRVFAGKKIKLNYDVAPPSKDAKDLMPYLGLTVIDDEPPPPPPEAA